MTILKRDKISVPVVSLENLSDLFKFKVDSFSAEIILEEYSVPTHIDNCDYEGTRVVVHTPWGKESIYDLIGHSNSYALEIYKKTRQELTEGNYGLGISVDLLLDQD